MANQQRQAATNRSQGNSNSSNSGSQLAYAPAPRDAPARRRVRRGRRWRLSIVPLRVIRRHQRTSQLLIPRFLFHRIVREVLAELSASETRFRPNALDALQEAAEAFLVNVFET